MTARRFVVLWSLVTTLAAAPASGVGEPSHVDMLVGATARSGGALAIHYDFARPVLVTPSVSDSGVTRYTTTQPGFTAVDPQSQTGPGLEPIRDGVPIRVEATAVEADASFKVGTITLDAPGKSAPLGTAPNLHVHGEWRLVLPDGVLAARRISLRLTTTAAGYRPSSEYTFVLTNDPAFSIPTTTTTLPAAHDQPLAGTRLALATGKAKTALQLIARDAGLSLDQGDDPRRDGATLRLTLQGPTPSDVRFALPPARWRALPRGRGFRFVGTAASEPVRSLRVQAGRGLVLRAEGSALPLVPPTPPDAIALVLEIGTRRWCLVFSDLARFRPSRRLLAAATPAPSSCPPP